ncbi:MAG TPA: 4-alpha-glucanotransferase, partial [Gaiellaceae bacterium]|nr:4-alpha-glucanotransferase [Gaiellaceae bacterium]
PVHRLRDELGLPGMVVLLWAFRPSRGNPHRLENHRVNAVAYTSTHDTATAAGWFESLGRRQRAATGLDPREPHWGLIELAYSSRARLAVVSAQDVLGLGDEARMNRPGVTEGNWRWQLERGALTPALARRLRGLAERHDRVT